MLALHGRGGSVQWWLDLGLPHFLNGVGLRCALVAGHDDYWVNLVPPVPYQAMLGISMGGFGVLDLATRQLTHHLSDEIKATGSFEHGAHNDGYWRRVLPQALSVLSAHL